jgi:UPF0271 protein
LFFVQSRPISPPRIDLNADVGESYGAYAMGDDEGLLAVVTSASVAAGFHGGDPSVLRRTIRLALARGVRIGAHPGFADLAGFGRRDIRLTSQEAEDLVLYQIAVVAGVCQAERAALRHVKPHGALYNMAAKDARLADAIVRAVNAFDSSLALYAPHGSQLFLAGQAAGLRVAAEAFADRAYEVDGTLAPRGTPGAVLTDPRQVVERAVQMVTRGTVTALNGAQIPIAADTLCIHSDTPGATHLASALRRGLEAAGIDVVPIS